MAKLTPVVIDFETFWSTTHSLTKMPPVEYVMHPETELISCAAKFGKEPAQCIFGESNIKSVLSRIDWSDKLVIGHNMSGFDAMILAWRCGVKPAMWGCTLAMSRPHHALDVGGSLGKLVEHYGIGKKDQSALLNTKGRHLCDFLPEEIEAMKAYNIADTEQCAELFKIFMPLTSKDEMRLIDMTTRMLVEPQFVADRKLLADTLAEEQARKKTSLLELAKTFCPEMCEEAIDTDQLSDYVKAQLASAPKFAAFLESRGVTPPTKASPANPENTTYALAKTDEEFLALQSHEDSLVAAAARSRLDVKSTLLETRIQKLLASSDAVKGKVPAPLKYYGGHTGRWSGEQYNLQNLPRVDPKNPKSTDALRKSLRAPKGYKVIVADLSGIELRVNHFLWKVPSSMALFQADPEKADLYKEFASELYQIEREAVSKDQRQVGKVAHLGLGFGAGAATFQKVAKLMAGITLDIDNATEVVQKWRGAYSEIVAGWKTCHASLPAILMGASFQIDPWGLCKAENGMIITPKGAIRYPALRKEEANGKTEWFYGEGRNKARIYAGKITENIVQHLARGVIADNALEFRRSTGLSPALMVHDELVYVVPENEAETHLATLQTIMRTPPDWWPELVTWSAGDIADCYGDAK